MDRRGGSSSGREEKEPREFDLHSGEHRESLEHKGEVVGERRWRSRGVEEDSFEREEKRSSYRPRVAFEEEEDSSSGGRISRKSPVILEQEGEVSGTSFRRRRLALEDEDLYDLPAIRQESVEEEEIFRQTREDEFGEHPMLHQEIGAVSSVDSDLFRWLESMICCVALAVVLGTFFGNGTLVSGSSMEPTLVDGQLLFLWSFGYRPEVGDIVVINKPTVDYLEGVSIVKRVVAVGGDRVVIDYTANTLFVNGYAVEEDYILERMRPIYGHEVSEEVIVPEGSIFVLGDNRNNSADSRLEDIGTVDVRYILGEAVLSLYPFSTVGFF